MFGIRKIVGLVESCFKTSSVIERIEKELLPLSEEQKSHGTRLQSLEAKIDKASSKTISIWALVVSVVSVGLTGSMFWYSNFKEVNLKGDVDTQLILAQTTNGIALNIAMIASASGPSSKSAVFKFQEAVLTELNNENKYIPLIANQQLEFTSEKHQKGKSLNIISSVKGGDSQLLIVAFQSWPIDNVQWRQGSYSLTLSLDDLSHKKRINLPPRLFRINDEDLKNLSISNSMIPKEFDQKTVFPVYNQK